MDCELKAFVETGTETDDMELSVPGRVDWAGRDLMDCEDRLSVPGRMDWAGRDLMDCELKAFVGTETETDDMELSVPGRNCNRGRKKR